jgi:hypothetical protein
VVWQGGKEFELAQGKVRHCISVHPKKFIGFLKFTK